jgi:uncharacterized protein YehS (DUF1456 family)
VPDFWDLRKFFPTLRRAAISISREAMRQWFRKEQRAGYKSRADVMAWCGDNFKDEKAMHHYLRIERRIGRSKLMLSQKFELSTPETQILHRRKYVWGSFKW